MVSLCKFTCLCTLILLIKPIFSQQSYDSTNCTAIPQLPGSNYLCNSNKSSCDTYIVYRAQDGYRTLSAIASLFDTSLDRLLSSNKNMSEEITIQHGQEIIVPVACSCPDRFSRAIFRYNASHSESLYTVACEVYEGLVKVQVLIEENPYFVGNLPSNSIVHVPIRCACPDVSDIDNGINYLVTYPVIEDDHMDLIARKFGVPENLIWSVNRLNTLATIFPQTTLLIPSKDMPVLNLDLTSLPENPSPSPRAIILDIFPGEELNNKNLYVFLGGGLSAILMVLACGVLVFIRRRNHPRNFQPLSAKSSQLSSFSPDLLDGMSKLKHSLVSFSPEELRIATGDFSQASEIGKAEYRGRIGASYLAIEKMNSEEAARHVISILTKINHLNVVKLEGCCYGTSGPNYLVYEFVENGSLRDCLSNVKLAKQLTWATRMQIAFDLAVGLHYIHYCTKPAYVHRNINSKNVLITIDWRAKISGFRLAKPLICGEEKEEQEANWIESVIIGRKGYLAPEYSGFGQGSNKVDVYAFGVVLLELLSGKEAIADGNLLKDSTSFLGNRGLEDSSSGCLEKLKGFLDPALEGDYPLGDAMCLALLARACVEEDPLHRPTMNDVLKALSRFL